VVWLALLVIEMIAAGPLDQDATTEAGNAGPGLIGHAVWTT
jgi:hypothetical protein